ncbi:MAG: hypothetical protein INF88_04315 [Roseomonas sp.]|nr:hypothetical protein [Roseomonas sp.]
MTKKRLQSDRDAVQRLEDALIEDVLGASDEDIRAEARADGIDLERQAESMRSMFEREIVQAGKEKMAAARSGLAAYRSGSSQIVSRRTCREPCPKHGPLGRAADKRLSDADQ